MENKYNVRHVPQTLYDYQRDIHWFTFYYNGEKIKASSIFGISIVYHHNGHLPAEVKKEVENTIWTKIRKSEKKWAIPKGAEECPYGYAERLVV